MNIPNRRTFLKGATLGAGGVVLVLGFLLLRLAIRLAG